MPSAFTEGIADGLKSAAKFLEEYASNYTWGRYFEHWEDDLKRKTWERKRAQERRREFLLLNSEPLRNRYDSERHDFEARIEQAVQSGEHAGDNYRAVIDRLMSLRPTVDEKVAEALDKAIEHVEESMRMDVVTDYWRDRTFPEFEEWRERTDERLKRDIQRCQEDIDRLTKNLSESIEYRAAWDKLVVQLKAQE